MGGYVCWIYPWIKTLGERSFRYAVVNISIRLLVWVLPVFLYLAFVEQVSPIEYLKLRRNWQRGVMVGLILMLLNLLGSTLRFGVPHLQLQALTWNSVIGTSILIGFVEEIP